MPDNDRPRVSDVLRITVAGAGYTAIGDYLRQVLPEAAVELVAPHLLREREHDATVLIPVMSRINGAMMDRIAGLQLIQQWGAGLEGVDIDAATVRGIAVANVATTGTGNAESVAEWCVMAAIAASRRLPQLERVIRDGSRWGGPIGRALWGKTAGVVGLGGIGQALVQRLAPFGMDLVAVTRRPDPQAATRLGLAWLSSLAELPVLLTRSDYLFLCLPLNEQTRGLIVATPHIAGVTDAAYQGVATRVADNIRRLLTGEALHDWVNPPDMGS